MIGLNFHFWKCSVFTTSCISVTDRHRSLCKTWLHNSYTIHLQIDHQYCLLWMGVNPSISKKSIKCSTVNYSLFVTWRKSGKKHDHNRLTIKILSLITIQLNTLFDLLLQHSFLKGALIRGGGKESLVANWNWIITIFQ